MQSSLTRYFTMTLRPSTLSPEVNGNCLKINQKCEGCCSCLHHASWPSPNINSSWKYPAFMRPSRQPSAQNDTGLQNSLTACNYGFDWSYYLYWNSFFPSQFYITNEIFSISRTNPLSQPSTIVSSIPIPNHKFGPQGRDFIYQGNSLSNVFNL